MGFPREAVACDRRGLLRDPILSPGSVNAVPGRETVGPPIVGPGMNGEALLILAGNVEAWFDQTSGGIDYDPNLGTLTLFRTRKPG